MRSYRIKEIFVSLQGEGWHAGEAALFIRFAGCNLKCPFCDTDFKGGREWTIWEIERYLEDMQDYPYLVVLTGGEPSLQVDDDLCNLLHLYFETVAMETNGTHPERIPTGVDWITLSPKDDFIQWNSPECKLGKANEVKVVFDGQRNPNFWLTHTVADYYYLQPCDTGDAEKNTVVTRKCVEYIEKDPRWRLSLQTQKILNIQ